jgi:hypothetical protein
LLRSHFHSAIIINSGIAIPIAAKMMWKASDIAICERAAIRSSMTTSSHYLKHL